MATNNTHTEAQKLAADIVRENLAVKDVEWLVREHMGIKYPQDGKDKLREAVYPGYTAVNQRLNELLNEQQPRETMLELEDLILQMANASESAGFHLGFAAALRLLGKG